jgi:hypothetical protein
VGARDFSSLQNVHTGTEAYPAWGSFPGIKRLEFAFDYSPPSSVEVKSEWSYNSAPPIYLHGAEKDKAAFFLILTSVLQ